MNWTFESWQKLWHSAPTLETIQVTNFTYDPIDERMALNEEGKIFNFIKAKINYIHMKSYFFSPN